MQKSKFKLTQSQTERQDFVDGAIVELLQKFGYPAEKWWNMELIGHIRDAIGHVVCDQMQWDTEQSFYPFEETETPTVVVFCRFKDGDIIALFPYEIVTKDGAVQSYMHVGQHSGADPHLVDVTQPATAEQYGGLKRTLESMGYVLDVKKRINWKRYTEAVGAFKG